MRQTLRTLLLTLSLSGCAAPLAATRPIALAPMGAVVAATVPVAALSAAPDATLAALVTAAQGGGERVTVRVRGVVYSCLVRPLLEYAAGNLSEATLREVYLSAEDVMNPAVAALPRPEL